MKVGVAPYDRLESAINVLEQFRLELESRTLTVNPPYMSWSRVRKNTVVPDDVGRSVKELYVFSTQRSGSTLFSQILKKKFGAGNPREHFNHALRGDFGARVEFSEVWKKGFANGWTAHKIMGSDLLNFSSLVTAEENALSALASLVEFIEKCPESHIFRVRRVNFLDQLLSSISAQKSGIYFGGKRGADVGDDAIDYDLLVNTWLRLKATGLLLDSFMSMFAPEKFFEIVYEKDLITIDAQLRTIKKMERRFELESADFDLEGLVSPPSTASEKKLMKSRFISRFKDDVGVELFEKMFDLPPRDDFSN